MYNINVCSTSALFFIWDHMIQTQYITKMKNRKNYNKIVVSKTQN